MLDLLKNLTIDKTILSDCLKCRKNTEGKYPSMIKTDKGKVILLSNCGVRDTETLRFIKEEALLKAHLRKIPQLGNNLFQRLSTR